MTVQQFQETYGGDLKSFLETKPGQAFIGVLISLMPGYDYPAQEHLLIENRGARRGYEQCIRNIPALCQVKIVSKDPEINYGVPDKQS